MPDLSCCPLNTEKTGRKSRPEFLFAMKGEESISNRNDRRSFDTAAMQPRQIATLRGLDRAKKLTKTSLQAPRPAASPWRRALESFWQDRGTVAGSGQQQPESRLFKKSKLPQKTSGEQTTKINRKKHDDTKVVRQHTILWHMCPNAKADAFTKPQHPQQISPRILRGVRSRNERHRGLRRSRSNGRKRKAEFKTSLTPLVEDLDKPNKDKHIGNSILYKRDTRSSKPLTRSKLLVPKTFVPTTVDSDIVFSKYGKKKLPSLHHA